MSKFVSENAFAIIRRSEELEGFNFDNNVDSSTINSSCQKFNKATILAFLECSDTKVQVVKSRTKIGTVKYYLFAHNKISNETIKIYGLGNHFIALVKVVEYVMKYKHRKTIKPNVNLMTNNMIKRLNRRILYDRIGEVAIGEYRDVDLFNRPVEVNISGADEFGRTISYNFIQLATSRNKNVFNEMDKLCNWINSIDASNLTDNEKLLLVAEFHARFIKIHPFRDGNGRTARLLMNYMMLAYNLPMINISQQCKNEYCFCLDYANTHNYEAFAKCPEFTDYISEYEDIYGNRTEENRYLPLAMFLKDRMMLESPNELIDEILNYTPSESYTKEVEAEQID